METITTLLGWCTVINFGFLLTSTILLVAMRSQITQIHGKLFGMEDEDLSKTYFGYLGAYKILVTVFNLVPYLALKIMAG